MDFQNSTFERVTPWSAIKSVMNVRTIRTGLPVRLTSVLARCSKWKTTQRWHLDRLRAAFVSKVRSRFPYQIFFSYFKSETPRRTVRFPARPSRRVTSFVRRYNIIFTATERLNATMNGGGGGDGGGDLSR